MPILPKNLVCDYLVVGAGAASMAFIDTLLTEMPDSKIVLVDKKPAPGGHWVDAYGYVRLHQPSLVYGVASKQLEGAWWKLLLKGTLPPGHRASKAELLAYFKEFVDEKIAAGQLDYYPNCEYNKEQGSDNAIHTFSSLDHSESYQVKVNVKVVNATEGEPIIPSFYPLNLPVDEGIRVQTPNQVYESVMTNKTVTKGSKYVVLGAGKTGMDAVVFLQRVMKVKPDDIAWVIPADVWIMDRSSADPWDWPKALLRNNLDFDKAALALENSGKFLRLDKNIMPKRFRFPVVDKSELALMRKVKTVIRRGRTTGLRVQDGNAMVEFGDGKAAWKAFAPADKCVFVHAATPGPFNGKYPDELFHNDHAMTIANLGAPPISVSMSSLAKMEAKRCEGTLDLEFGRQLLQTKFGDPEEKLSKQKYSENDVLHELIRGFNFVGQGTEQVCPIFTMACFYAIMDKDPMVTYNWMKQNRLSLLSIPGYKTGLYDDICKLHENGLSLGFKESDVRMFGMLAEKLEPLKGK